MFAHYVNSYKRYQPESWAPTALAWGHDNRTCGYRLVGHGPAYRVESRIPGADVNPYLAYAAIIAAGLHGVDERRRAARAVRRQRVRRARPPPRAVDAARGDRAVRGVGGRDGGVRARGAPPPGEHGAAGVAHASTARSPTGSAAATSSRSDADGDDAVPAPLIALPAYPMPPGRVDGWADPAVAIQAMYVESLQRAGAQEAVLGPRHLDHGEALAVLERFDGRPPARRRRRDPRALRRAARRADVRHDPAARRVRVRALQRGARALAPAASRICRGTQVLNVALGGTLAQHITDEFPGHGTPGVEGGQHVHDVSVDADVPRRRRDGHVAGALLVPPPPGGRPRRSRPARDGTRATTASSRRSSSTVPTWVTAVQWHPEDTAADDPGPARPVRRVRRRRPAVRCRSTEAARHGLPAFLDP